MAIYLVLLVLFKVAGRRTLAELTTFDLVLLMVEHWLGRADTPQSLSFTCELGPPPYAITDAQGRELTDRWAEALKLKALIRQVWASCHR